MVEPAPPAGPFPAAAARALAPVAGQVEQVREQAAAGGLRIDLTAAEQLLRQVQQVRQRAGDLAANGSTLDTPLHFGDNWVGRIMSARLRSVAVDEHGGVTPVLRMFHDVLDSVEAVIRLAAGLYRTTDEQVESDLRLAASRLGDHSGLIGNQS
ncbi:hypothetical protein [Actinophytocola sediminis]